MVIAGDIVAGPHVRNACRRHMDDLKREDIVYDETEAARAIRFFETKLRLSEGQFEGKPFKSQPAQDFIIGSLFGWKKLDGFRRFRRAYIEQGKGNGKSPLAGGIGLYGMMADNEAGAEIYAAGATKDQAGILFRDAVKMVDKSPDLAKRITSSGGPGREYNLAYLKTGSFFRPISRETKKTGSGPRPHMALVDELHEHPDGGVLEILEAGFKFRQQPLLLMITNSGSDRNSVCWEEHEHAVKVAAGNLNAKDGDSFYLGEVLDDDTFSYVCALDKDDNPLDDPSCWIKANPLLDVTITREYIEGRTKQARSIPGKANKILRLNFCQWTDAANGWMIRETLEPCIVDFEPLDEHAGAQLFMGADLSQVKDMTSLGYCVQSGTNDEGKPVFDAWIEAWTPKDTIRERADADKLPYEEWVKAGHLQAASGKSINYLHIAQAIAEANHDYDLQCLAYDRYAFSRMLEPKMRDLGLEIECIEHPQGGVKKGKPTEAMKESCKAAGREPEGLWMPMSVRQLEELIFEGRIRLKRNPVLISAMMSAVTDEDRWGNVWLTKDNQTKKIDAVIALLMAVGAAMAHENAVSAYSDRGILVL